MSESVLEISNLTVEAPGSIFSNPARILHEISFSVPRGKIFGFLGPNGSGKTTTIKTVLGLVPEYQGQIRLLGKSPSTPGLRMQVGYSPENAYFSDFLTPREVLASMGKLSNMEISDIRARTEELLSALKLSHVIDQPIQTFSKGMKQRLNIAQCLLHNPEFLILDEPGTGLDPIGRMEIRQLIRDLKSAGKSILLCTHNLLEAQEICDDICILNGGKVVKSCQLNQVISNEKNLEQVFIELVQGDKS